MNFAGAFHGRSSFIREAAVRTSEVYVLGSRPSTPLTKPINEAAEVDEQHLRRRFTALHEACFRGHEHVVRDLLARKADVNVKDVDGRTPLDIAIYQSHSPCVIVLSQYIDNLPSDDSGTDEEPDVFLPCSPTLLAPKTLAIEVKRHKTHVKLFDQLKRLSGARSRSGSAASSRPHTASASGDDERQDAAVDDAKHTQRPSTASVSSCAKVELADRPRTADDIREFKYKRREKFERPLPLSTKYRKNPPVNVRLLMKKTRKGLGDKSIGQSVFTGFRQVRRREAEIKQMRRSSERRRRAKKKEQKDIRKGTIIRRKPGVPSRKVVRRRKPKPKPVGEAKEPHKKVAPRKGKPASGIGFQPGELYSILRTAGMRRKTAFGK